MSVRVVAKREFASLFRTPIGFLLIGVTLLLNALQLNAVAMGTGDRPSTVVLETFLLNAAFVTEVLAVVLSTRLVLAPTSSPLLLSAPVRPWTLALGGYLASLSFLAIATLASLYLPALILAYGKVSLGHVAAGYAGTLLVGAACLGIGAAVASGTRHPIVALVTTATIIGVFELSFYVAGVASLEWRPWLRALAPVWNHHESFRRGIVQLSDVVYLLSVAAVGVYAAGRSIGERRQR
ncbi:MAG: hypothetical protein AAGE52_41945 [Myxococcota bacterium]